MRVIGLILLGLWLSPPAFAKGELSWSINLHAVDTQYDSARSVQVLNDAQTLGVKMLRMFVHWYDLEPTPGQYSETYLAALDSFISDAKSRQIEIIAVLTHPPAWAFDRYKQGDVGGFMEAYSKYAEVFARRFGDRINYYNYWNEPNNGIMDGVDTQDDWLITVYGDRGVRRGDPNGYSGMINYTADIFNGPRWIEHLTYVCTRLKIIAPDNQVRIVAVDIYPDTWGKGGAQSWKAIDDLNAVITQPKHPCFGMDAAIGETGFSSFLPTGWGSWFGRTETDQDEWFKRALPELREKLELFNQNNVNQYVFVNLYEMYDHASPVPFNPEANWGLFRLDGTPKPAVKSVRELIAK